MVQHKINNLKNGGMNPKIPRVYTHNDSIHDDHEKAIIKFEYKSYISNIN